MGCEFVQYELLPISISNTTKDSTMIHFGIWYRQSIELYNYTDFDSGEGGYYEVSTCTGYPDDIDIDPRWVAGRVFSVLVLILGGIALMLAIATCCCSCLNQNSASIIDKLNGGIYLLAMICQGLTFITLSSNLCENGDVGQIMNDDDKGVYRISEECNLSDGANCIVSAIVFWCLAGVLSCDLFRTKRKKMEMSLMNTNASSSSLVEPLLS